VHGRGERCIRDAGWDYVMHGRGETVRIAALAGIRHVAIDGFTRLGFAEVLP
jgi:hypothetical protein